MTRLAMWLILTDSLTGSNSSIKYVSTSNSKSSSSSSRSRMIFNKNGTISKDEFTNALHSLNLSLTEEDCNTLFSRFQTHSNDNVIDWKEFLSFFTDHAQKAIQQGKIALSLDNDEQSIGNLILRIQNAILSDKTVLTSPRIPGLKVETDAPSQLIPDNAVFINMRLMDAKINAEKLRMLQVDISDEDMGRISRIFGYNVVAFMDFVRGNGQGLGHNDDRDLKSALTLARKTMLETFLQRCGGVTKPKADPLSTSSSSTTKTILTSASLSTASKTPSKTSKASAETPIRTGDSVKPLSSSAASPPVVPSPLPPPPPLLIPTTAIPMLWRALVPSSTATIGFDEISCQLMSLLEDYLHTVDRQ
eukprot:gene3479-6925_t